MPIRRVLRKIKIGRKIRANRTQRAGRTVIERAMDRRESPDSFAEIARRYGNFPAVRLFVPRNKGEKDEDYGFRLARKIDQLQRHYEQIQKNKSRGKGKNSSYKLTGVDSSDNPRTRFGINPNVRLSYPTLYRELMEREESTLQPDIKDFLRWNILAAEADARKQWLRKPEAHRKEMEEWLKKHGRRK